MPSSRGGILSAGSWFGGQAACSPQSFPSTILRGDVLKYLLSTFQLLLAKSSQLAPGFFHGTLTLDKKCFAFRFSFSQGSIYSYTTHIVCPEGLSLVSSHRSFTRLAFSKPTCQNDS